MRGRHKKFDFRQIDRHRKSHRSHSTRPNSDSEPMEVVDKNKVPVLAAESLSADDHNLSDFKAEETYEIKREGSVGVRDH